MGTELRGAELRGAEVRGAELRGVELRVYDKWKLEGATHIEVSVRAKRAPDVTMVRINALTKIQASSRGLLARAANAKVNIAIQKVQAVQVDT